MPKKPIVPAVKALSDEIRQTQGVMMTQRRLLGSTVSEIAQEFRVSTATVRDRLQLARESGVLQQAQVIILEKLLPLAVAAYAHALSDESGDPELRLKAAKDLMFGTSALETKQKSTVIHEAGDSLETYRLERAKRAAIPTEFEVDDAQK